MVVSNKYSSYKILQMYKPPRAQKLKETNKPKYALLICFIVIAFHFMPEIQPNSN